VAVHAIPHPPRRHHGHVNATALERVALPGTQADATSNYYDV